MIKMYSPTGNAEIFVHPARVERMESIGWTQKKPSKPKKEKQEESPAE